MSLWCVHAIDGVSWTHGVLCVHGELVGQSILHTMMLHAKGVAFDLTLECQGNEGNDSLASGGDNIGMLIQGGAL